MTDFTALVTTSGATPDPSKHVNFTQGMVLGADDFNQEFAYLAGRDQWLARDLIGYGVVAGLGVTVDTDGMGRPRVKVAPGVALSPRGELICVGATQCALLNDWLDAEKLQLTGLTRVLAYVVLCYRDCATDRVPIPGEPCRSEDALTAPSRVKDDFRLELRLRPPAQEEEDALRDFVAWLRLIPVLEGAPPGGFLEPDAFAEELTRAAFLTGSPPSPPDFMYGSPPTALRIPAGRYAAYIRVAFDVWARELRAFWRADRVGGCCEPPDEGCLLLAAVDLALAGGTPPTVANRPALPGATPLPDATPRFERRPFLVHLRMLQEWVLSGGAPGSGGGGGGPAPSPGGTPPAIVFGGSGAEGVLAAYSRADHVHAAPPVPQPGGPPGALSFGVTGVAGDSPNFAPANHTHTLPALPPVPAAATMPPTANTYGQLGGVGDSDDYARANHAHPMPVAPRIPDPGDTTEPIIFGGGGSSGFSELYARADHVHPAPSPGGLGRLVAAGRFTTDPSPGPDFAVGGLVAFRLGDAKATLYLLRYDGYKSDTRHTVTGAPWVRISDSVPHVFEYMGRSADKPLAEGLEGLLPTVDNPELQDLVKNVGIKELGLVIRVQTIGGDPADLGFVVEITALEG